MADMAPDDRKVLTAALSTRRLVLRLPVPGDVAGLVAIGNDLAIARNLANLPFPFTPKQAQALVDRTGSQARAGRGRYFVLEERVSGRLVGYAGLSLKQAPVGELTYWIGREFSGRGFATEAAGGLIKTGFAHWGLERIIAWHGCDNPASRRVQEKLGMRFSGMMGLVFSLGRGQLVACRLMELSKEEACL